MGESEKCDCYRLKSVLNGELRVFLKGELTVQVSVATLSPIVAECNERKFTLLRDNNRTAIRCTDYTIDFGP